MDYTAVLPLAHPTSFRLPMLQRLHLPAHRAFAFSVAACLILKTACAEESAHSNAVEFIELHCMDCHTGPDSERGFDLTDFATTVGPSLDTAKDTTAWEKVLLRIQSRQMPPADAERPSEEEFVAAERAINQQLAEDAAAHPFAGKTDALRRLTRTEYQNSIRDLLGLEVDLTSLLPADQSSDGFDNITVGELSPMLLDRYLTAARRISRAAIGTSGDRPDGITVRIPADQTQEGHVAGLPYGTRGGTVVRHHFPVAGEYEFQVRLTRDRDELVEGLKTNHDLDLLVDRKPMHRFTVKPPRGGQGNQTVDVGLNKRLSIPAGKHDIGVAFIEQSTPLFEIKRQPFDASFNRHRHPRRNPAIAEVSIIGPFSDAPQKGSDDSKNELVDSAISESRGRVIETVPDEHHTTEQAASQNFRSLLRTAYRRPITEDDLAVPMQFFQAAYEAGDETTGNAGDGFERGMESGLTSILVNPNFLFRVSVQPRGVPAETPYRISDIELASRLSFFLWSSLPDEILLGAAERESLDQKELRNQTVRMIADPRSRSLVDSFADQWLFLRNLPTITPDLRQFPSFDNNLREAFAEETRQLFADVVRRDASVLDLLSCDHTFLNERLATHYGIPGVIGSHFRRVEMKPEYHRGGLLRHGSILMATSYATRTSPTIRGAWVLDNILGTPPPPPPPNVPTIKESASGRKLTFRESLALHRSNSACASCHDLIDPVGFALDQYDAVGRFRAKVESEIVDARGRLPDGQEVFGVEQLETGILKNPEMFVMALTRKLMTYALGRPLEHRDGPAVRKIVEQSRINHYRFSDLVVGIAQSTPFQMRQSQ